MASQWPTSGPLEITITPPVDYRTYAQPEPVDYRTYAYDPYMPRETYQRDPYNPYAPPEGGEVYWTPEQGQTATDRVAGAVARMPIGIAESAWEAFKAPGEAYSQGMTQDEMIRRSAALADFVSMGGIGLPAMTGAAGMGRRTRLAAPETSPGIKAYHGSPHDFDKFSMEKIGTGEGAQAYGHGLYFAENEGVARSYKTAGVAPYLGNQQYGYVKDAIDATAGKDEALKLLNEKMLEFKDSGNSFEYAAVRDAINNFDELANKVPGRTYEVSIDASPDEFLDWDKPLSEQPESVRYLFEGESSDATASTLYNNLAEELGQEGASERLADYGIKGVRYKDAGSRTVTPPRYEKTPEGYAVYWGNDPKPVDVFPTEQAARSAVSELDTRTNNYVVFDDEIISILKKYGVPGLIAAGMGEEVAKGIAAQYGLEGEVY